MTRHAKGSVHYNNIIMKYNEKQKELVSLRASEKSIAVEQDQRKNRAKLSIFWCIYIYAILIYYKKLAYIYYLLICIKNINK